MALAKVKNGNKIIIGILLGALLISSATIGSLYNKNNSLKEDLASKEKLVKELQSEASTLRSKISVLEEELSIKVNSVSDIRLIRKDLISKINEIVKEKDKKIAEVDILRALNSTENRIMEEYIRVASLILATMETETDFRHMKNKNKNGTYDHGIMQVNDAIIPHVKEALGDWIDPINNKDHNVEAGSYEIYECYLKAKDKHPEDVIWWTYAYYNRGLYFESTDAWKNKNNPSHEAVHNQANARSQKFKKHYESYYNTLMEAVM